MKGPSLGAGITFTQPYHGLWLISLYGKRVGTVEGNSVFGFTARDIDGGCPRAPVRMHACSTLTSPTPTAMTQKRI